MIAAALARFGCGLLVTWCAATPACAQAGEAAQDQIRAALMKWTADFNTRNSAKICDLFAPDLRYDYRGVPERGYQDLCELLQRSLSDTDKRYHYSPAIKEIVVAGDLAIVRLTWTLTVRTPGSPDEVTTDEIGLDVLRKQPDGSWKIVRYIAYEAPK